MRARFTVVLADALWVTISARRIQADFELFEITARLGQIFLKRIRVFFLLVSSLGCNEQKRTGGHFP